MIILIYVFSWIPVIPSYKFLSDLPYNDFIFQIAYKLNILIYTLIFIKGHALKDYPLLVR